jgi:hypothetical protein
MSKIPVISEVESKKKSKYLIAKEVKEIISEDIKRMAK